MARESFKGMVIVGKPWNIEEISETKEDKFEFCGTVKNLDEFQFETKSEFIENSMKSE